MLTQYCGYVVACVLLTDVLTDQPRQPAKLHIPVVAYVAYPTSYPYMLCMAETVVHKLLCHIRIQ